jgi:hypothetical protein
MYEVLQDNVMVVANNQWIRTKAILTKARGGLQVNYTDENGIIVKKEAFSSSPYGKGKSEDLPE